MKTVSNSNNRTLVPTWYTMEYVVINILLDGNDKIQKGALIIFVVNEEQGWVVVNMIVRGVQ